MDESLQAQIAIYLSRLGSLIRRGREVHTILANGAPNAAAAARSWQEECGVTINQLSGGSKSHWLARAFSEAFLMRSTNGQAIEKAALEEIVQRLISVLEQAVGALSRKDDSPVISASSEEPPPRRFDFVHNRELRPVVEQAFLDSRRAFEQGNYDEAMRTACGILEAIVTDALEHKGLSALAAVGAPVGRIADWPFETRLAVAESAGLIRGGCARLPEVARTYRDHAENVPEARASEQDARRTAQVLRVVMRDLDPGR